MRRSTKEKPEKCCGTGSPADIVCESVYDIRQGRNRHVVTQVPDLLENLFNVIDGSVIGGQLNACQSERTLPFVVKENQVTTPQNYICDHLIGGTSAVQNKVGLVGTEYACCVALDLGRRSFVNEEVSEADVSIAEIVSKDALSEVLEEQLPGK